MSHPPTHESKPTSLDAMITLVVKGLTRIYAYVTALPRLHFFLNPPTQIQNRAFAGLTPLRGPRTDAHAFDRRYLRRKQLPETRTTIGYPFKRRSFRNVKFRWQLRTHKQRTIQTTNSEESSKKKTIQKKIRPVTELRIRWNPFWRTCAPRVV